MKSTKLSAELQDLLGVNSNDAVLEAVKRLAEKQPAMPLLMALAVDPETGRYMPISNINIQPGQEEQADGQLAIMAGVLGQIQQQYQEARLQLARGLADVPTARSAANGEGPQTSEEPETEVEDADLNSNQHS